MEAMLNTCAIMIARVLDITLFRLDPESPCPQAPLQPSLLFDQQLARSDAAFYSMLAGMDDAHLYEVKDHAGILWLMFRLGTQVAVLGPYRSGLATHEELLQVLSSLGLERSQLNDLKEYRAGITEAITAQVVMAAHAVRECVYGQRSTAPVECINLADKNAMMDLHNPHLRPMSSYVEHTHDMQGEYMEVVAKGDGAEAMRLMRMIMRREAEGKSELTLLRRQISSAIARTLTRIAARRAGVPSGQLDSLCSNHNRQTMAARSIQEVDHLLYELIETICGLVTRALLSAYSPLIRKAVHLVSQNLAEPISVASIAGDIGVTPNYLSSRFHEETGMRLSAYVRDRRLEAAARLLRDSALPVMNVGMAVGIPDSSYFARLFRNKFGVSPSDFRGALFPPANRRRSRSRALL